MAGPSASNGGRLWTRHYCAGKRGDKTCGAPVSPYSRFERLTLAPGEAVLLASFNNRDPENRTAWCFSCDGFRPCERMTVVDILKMYRSREGVEMRRPGARR